MTLTEPHPIDVFGRDGLRLRADEFGDLEGPPVVLLHGGGQTRYAWGSTARVLAERGWHVLRVDLRGHGESDWPDDGDYGPDAFAGDVTAIATTLLAPPVLVGASLGGIASILAIGRAPKPSPAASCSSTSHRRSSRTARCASARS